MTGEAALRFFREPEPIRGEAREVAPGIRRIVARNASRLTYRGTNTYLVESAGGCLVVDPGPADAGHVDDLLAATGGRIAMVFVTHSHPDHIAALPALRERVAVPVAGFDRGLSSAFRPDVALHEGEALHGLTAIHTPGHASDHFCFSMKNGVLFSGDHVMSWSTTVVSPPDGDMLSYLRSLERLLARDDRLYLPGHGPPFAEPRPFLEGLLNARRDRESAILRSVSREPRSARALVRELYRFAHPELHGPAERIVKAHLLKLQAEGYVICEGEIWRTARSDDPSRAS